MKELVAIGGDADALDERFAGRAQRLAVYHDGCYSKRGNASRDSGGTEIAREVALKTLARSNLSQTERGPTGDERAENNLEPNYNRERHKAGYQDFANLLTANSNFRPRTRGGS